MKIGQDQLKTILIQIMREHAPDMSEIPDHVFSDRFEANMDSLIKKEAAHPWAVSRHHIRNLLIAAVLIALLFAVTLSVNAMQKQKVSEMIEQVVDAVNEQAKKFVITYYSDSAGIETKRTTRDYVEHIYVITAVPERFTKNEVIDLGAGAGQEIRYFSEEGGILIFVQNIGGGSTSIDTERSEVTETQIDGHQAIYSHCEDTYMLIWEADEYYFRLVLFDEKATENEFFEIYHSIR